jgi:hypothetical protein
MERYTLRLRHTGQLSLRSHRPHYFLVVMLSWRRKAKESKRQDGVLKRHDTVTTKIIRKFIQPPDVCRSGKSAVLHTVAGPYHAVR